MTQPPGTKADFVERNLRESILRGELRPGDWIRIDDWARRLGVSRTPVREALKSLQASGIITVVAHIGATVSALPLGQFIDSYSIRSSLEALGTEWAVSRNDGAELAGLVSDLHSLHEQLVEVINDPGGFREVNRRWHRRIMAAAHSDMLLQVLASIWNSQPFDTGNLLQRDLSEVVTQHGKVMRCIENGDANGASQAMKAHVDDGARRVEAAVRAGRISILRSADNGGKTPG